MGPFRAAVVRHGCSARKQPIKQSTEMPTTTVVLMGRFPPRGPKDQKKSRFRSRLKISIENEIFERATHRGPIFCGEIETSRSKFSSEINNFDRDRKFRSRSNFFDRWALWASLVGRFPTLVGRSPDFVLGGPFKHFPLENLLENSPLRKALRGSRFRSSPSTV